MKYLCHASALVLLLFATGCSTIRPLTTGHELSTKDVAGKEVIYAVKPQCAERQVSEVSDLQAGNLALTGGGTVPTSDLCYLQRRQVELNPVFYLKRAGLAIVSIPVVIVAAVAGAPCMLHIRC